MFEIPAQDRPHPDVLGKTLDVRAQAAHTADDQVDRSTVLRRSVERVDHLRIDQVVHLDDDPPVLAPLLAPDEVEQLIAHAVGSDAELSECALPAVPREEVEKV